MASLLPPPIAAVAARGPVGGGRGSTVLGGGAVLVVSEDVHEFSLSELGRTGDPPFGRESLEFGEALERELSAGIRGRGGGVDVSHSAGFLSARAQNIPGFSAVGCGVGCTSNAETAVGECR